MIYPLIFVIGLTVMFCLLKSFDMLIGAMFPDGVSYTLVLGIKRAYGFTVSFWWASVAWAIMLYGDWLISAILK